MKNLLDDGARREILGRLDSLRADSAPRWGKMDAGRMLCHLSESMRMGFGELSVKSKGMRAFQRFPLKHLIVYVLPFPKGAPTAPELLAKKPERFDADRDTLRQLLAGAPERCKGGAEHPLFGVLGAREWGALGYKHVDHHFRQFGV